ncbi:MAG: DinB family protein [Bacteroidota bacterium]
MKQNTELRSLLQTIDECFAKRAWHGPNLRGSIRGLSARQAAWRPSPKRHNIWEIVVHCAYWKYVVRRRILGEKRGSFPLEGSNWFRRPENKSEVAWRRDIQLLEDMHELMVEAIEDLKPADLKKKVWKSWSTHSTIAGIAMHDVYHAGQIQLLKRLVKQ